MSLKKKFMVLAALAAMGAAVQAQTYTGFATTVAGSGTGGTRVAEGIVAISSNDLDTVTVKGVTFDATTLANASSITNQGNGFDYSINVAQKQFLYSTRDTEFDYVKAGSYISRITNAGQIDTLFVQGEATPESAVPTIGTASYAGGAVVREIVGTSGGSGSTAATTASFDVNFGSKALTGTIVADGTVLTNNLALAATLSGNGFSGTSGDLSTQGSFYGPNAEELGGVFQSNSANVAGVFAAKQ